MTLPSAHAHQQVCAIVVTHNPDLAGVAALLERIILQVGGVIITDNGSCADLREQLEAVARKHEGVEVVALDSNRGLASGQNIGIRAALERSFRFVLVLDQDSLPAPDMVHRLVAAFGELSAQGSRLAAVGPRYLQRHSGAGSYFVQFGLLGFRRIYCSDAAGRVRADFLISSGCLLSSDALRDVGLMMEDLFIDHVDTEWFLRAASRNWTMYGVCDAMMEHALGDAAIRVWFGRWRHVAKHSPLRHYYAFRNSAYLYTHSAYPWRWKLADAGRLTGLLLVFGTCSDEKIAHIRMMLAGIRDGLRGRLGRFESPPRLKAEG